MEADDFTDLNTTELFDDSNDSLDGNEKDNNIVSNISSDDNLKTTGSCDNANVSEDFNSLDAGKTSTDLVSWTLLLIHLSFSYTKKLYAIVNELSNSTRCHFENRKTQMQWTLEVLSNVIHVVYGIGLMAASVYS